MSASAKVRPLVIGFVGENENGSLKTATHALNAALEQFGIDGHCIDFFDPSWSDRLRALLADRTPHFCYGYAGVGAGLLNGAQSFWSAHKIPFLSLMYDHPFANLEQHTIDSPCIANCYFVADFLDARLKYVSNPQRCFLMRDICDTGPQPDSPLTEAAHRTEWKNREIAHLFLKTGNNPAHALAATEALAPEHKAIFNDCAELLKKSADYNLTDLVAEHCRAQQIEPSASNIVFVDLVRLLDRYIRDWRSTHLVHWLKTRPAMIIGNGWDFIDKENARATFLPSRPLDECLKLYGQSRFAYNANPCFRDGTHERTHTALRAGAIAVTDRNRFSDHVYSSLENFLSFDWGNPNWREELDERITDIETNGGGFDTVKTQRHLSALFPLEPFVTVLFTAAQKIRTEAKP